MTEHLGYGRGDSRAAGEGRAVLLISGIGAGCALAVSEAFPGRILAGCGASDALARSEAAWVNLIIAALGQSQAQSQADAYLRKFILDCELLADPNILVRFRPHIGGGGVLTYRAGGPGVATYWDIVGIGPDCFEEPPHGSLRWHYVKADMAGLAVNIYISPADPVMAGHRDRIIVRRADA